ncbi:hypothetical protein AF331_13845 [Rossellomorea marisflavi]|uniref:DUF4181 domain-containing protein n=4 Tax=Rossellomorea marisflavi TaxID=189381 RepID=A0A0M0G5D3_9BACI|nr:DUF4181 domain-containing protein [Rossellomorea marisflavi]KON85064.1 hypothetical protein AF331_13845 [Rossellomorea marisflavi]KQU63129.1 hypothetical protein ASG66_01575 [Bacillus sp. Leaf406]USK92847.1 DUF4181 domain-containing protein [Rossellomorea marisflavi]
MNGILFFLAFFFVYHIGSFILGRILKRKLHLGKKMNRHYNETHRQWDKRIRRIILVIMMFGLGISYYYDFDPLFVCILVLIGFILQELSEAYMDWKYSEERNEYVRSLIEAGYMAFSLTLFIAILSTSIL